LRHGLYRAGDVAAVSGRAAEAALDGIFLTGPPGTTSLPSMSIEFLLTSLVVAVIPGTGVVYTVSSSIGGGRQRGLVAAIDCTLGIVPHMLAAMLGLSANRSARF
jgi:hypothetical protein